MAVTLHTSHGDLKVEIFCERVPRIAENFLALCASGKYNGTLFHRNIKGFMLQGGDPTNSGTGGTSIWGKYIPDEFHASLHHDKRGILSMANSGPDTNGSQFFVTYAQQEHLDKVYSVFGQVIDHLDTLDTMERVPVDDMDKPLKDIMLESITIHANPFADEKVL